MSNTRIVLDRQSDLLLTSATLSFPHISSPTGLVQGDISGLTSSLASLESKDQSIDNRISTETDRLNSADTSLNTKISNEESTRVSGDSSLNTRVSTEESNRASGDTSLTNKVSTEEVNRANADTSLTTRVSTEEVNRANADTSLTTRVSTEEVARENGDSSLATDVSKAQASIDVILSASTIELDQFAEIVSFVSSIDVQNDSLLQSVEDSLNDRVSLEEVARGSADGSLESKISEEEYQ